jgi:thiol:disulfide interchange protein
MLLRLITLLYCVLFPVMGLAQSAPVKTDITTSELISAVDTIQPDQKFWVALHLNIKDGWHAYWKNPGDSGVPPVFKWTLPSGFTADDIHYLAPDRQKYIDLMNFGYHGDAYFLVPVTPPKLLRENASYIFTLNATWLVCEEICIPEKGEYSIILRTNADKKSTPSEHFDRIASLVSKLPKPYAPLLHFDVKENQFRIEIPSELLSSGSIKEIQFFPSQSGIIENAAEQKLETTEKGAILSITRGSEQIQPNLDGILSLFSSDERRDFTVSLEAAAAGLEHGGESKTSSPEIDGVLQAVLFALFGGLILNLMPCVFPVLSLKALDIARHASLHAQEVKRKGIAYSIGIILSFLLMAIVLIIVQQAGNQVGWGTQFQSPFVVGVFAYLLFLIGLNLSGVFEIPSIGGNLGSKLTQQKGLSGSFFTGVLAVLVATPCTAPFMGGAIGYAFTQPSTVVLAVFIALGIGMALPFLLISYFPKIISRLPKPGVWMNHFKQFLAFPMYLSAIWLLWVLGRQSDTDLIVGILLGFAFIGFVFWLWRFFKDADILIRIGMAIPLIIISAIPLFFLPIQSVTRDQNVCVPSTMLEHGEPFSMTRLNQLLGMQKPVLVNATAAWCITCQINERTTLGKESMQSAFAEHDVTYLVADWTNHNDEITAYLNSFGRKGVPLYIYYPPKGKPVILPQILTESTVLDVITKK